MLLEKKDEELVTTHKQLKFEAQMVHELQIKKNTDAGHSISLSNRIKDLTLMLEEKDRQLQQKENNYDNIKLLFDAEKKEHERTSKDFHASLE